MEQPVRIGIVARDQALRDQIARLFDPAPESWSVRFFEQAPDEADALVTVDLPQASLATGVPQVLPCPDRPGVIAITSAGGCGATTLAVHLAREMAGRESVTLVDLDTNFRGLAARLGILDPDAKSWADIDPNDPLSLRLAALPVAGGFRVLLSPQRPAEPDLPAILSTGGTVLMDVPPSAPLETILPLASAGVLVVDRTAVSAARAAHVLRRSPNMAWAVVVNATGPRAQLSKAKIAESVGLPVSIVLPYSAAVRESETKHALSSRLWNRWSWGVTRLAGALEKL